MRNRRRPSATPRGWIMLRRALSPQEERLERAISTAHNRMLCAKTREGQLSWHRLLLWFLAKRAPDAWPVTL